MQHIFFSTLPIFLITLLGSFIRKNWLTAEEFWRGLEKLSYFLLFPAVLFNYILRADLSSMPLIRLVIALIIATTIIAIILIVHRTRNNADSIKFTSTFQGAIRYNSYIFFGLTDALFGNEGLAIVAVISSYMIVYTNVLSVVVFAKYIPGSQQRGTGANMKALMKLIFSNPLIIASCTGFAFNYSGMKLNVGIAQTISVLASSALAIGMLNVGAGLKFVLCREDFKQVVFTSVIKLVLFPIVTASILSYMSITGMPKSIGLLYSCLPCASTAYVLSRQLGGDPDSMAAIITFTTIFSIVSLTILMYILGSL